MTGELSDAFATRAEGVAGVAAIAERLLAPGKALFYAARAGFVDGASAPAHAKDIASANWHASAALVGARANNALFIDMGSTTTDIIPVAAGLPASCGFDDAGRLAHGELVYTGLVRTFLMAGPKLVPFAGRWTALMNEWFADMADVHRILGALPEGADMMDSADGREKTVAASMARLARMIGRDAAGCDGRRLEAPRAIFRRGAVARDYGRGGSCPLARADRRRCAHRRRRRRARRDPEARCSVWTAASSPSTI